MPYDFVLYRLVLILRVNCGVIIISLLTKLFYSPFEIRKKERKKEKMAASGDLKDLTFTVLYYQGQGLGELPRNLIRVGGLLVGIGFSSEKHILFLYSLLVMNMNSRIDTQERVR